MNTLAGLFIAENKMLTCNPLRKSHRTSDIVAMTCHDLIDARTQVLLLADSGTLCFERFEIALGFIQGSERVRCFFTQKIIW